MKESKPFTPHSVECHTGPHGSLIRVCKNCGASWHLTLDNEHRYSWLPVFELGMDSKPIDAVVDIMYCYAGSGGVTQTTTTQPVISPNSNERKCYCSDCHKNGRKEHYPGEERCFCVKCRGSRAHKIA